MMTRRKPFNSEICFNLQVKEILFNLFNVMIRAEVYFDEMKMNFKNKKFDLSLFFSFMDKDKNGFLTLNEVKYF
jgi:hypothetical protein